MIDLKDIVAISGMGGLFRINARRPDGLIVTSFEETKPKFVSNRIHIFTPLEGITLYTYTDNIELSKVLLEMKKQSHDNAPTDPKESNQAHKDYFRTVCPEFDDERVYVSDIKKVIRWYFLLDKEGLLVEKEETSSPTTEQAEAPAEATAVEPETVKEEKPAKKTKKAPLPTEDTEPTTKVKKSKKGEA
ncbi:MAG: DUF5606 domain-containing protein [Chitinophagales bacterium]|nr:DUF5606 domain-containing protein [Chitinophagales bacterium]